MEFPGHSITINTTNYKKLTIGSITTENGTDGLKLSHQAGTYDISSLSTVTLSISFTTMQGCSNATMHNIVFSD